MRENLPLDFIEKWNEYKESYPEEKLERFEKEKEIFLKRFPLDKWPEFSLEDYVLGKNKDGISWWLEYGTEEIASIKGGSAIKHVVYYSTKKGKWMYVKGFKDENEAFEKIRKEVMELSELFNNSNWKELRNPNRFSNDYVIFNKLMFIYFDELLLPINKREHLIKFLKLLDAFETSDNNISSIGLSRKLRLNAEELFGNSVHPQVITMFFYDIYDPNKRYWKIAPGHNAEYWDDCLKGGYICIGWDKLGDLKKYNKKTPFKNDFANIYGPGYNDDKSTITKKHNELWQFAKETKEGHLILANNGISEIVGIGRVKKNPYQFRDERKEYKHTINVDWFKTEPFSIEPIKRWSFKTVEPLKISTYESIVSQSRNNIHAKPNRVSFKISGIFKTIAKQLQDVGQIIFYGPPGTGKTYIAKQFAKEWLEEENGAEKHGEQLDFLTFHPSLTYEDFIEGYKPEKSEGEQLQFKLKPGVFKELCKKAKKSKEEKFLLIIDEINRANMPKVFGELITLLEKDKRGYVVKLPQSQHHFSIPDNLYIIGTMNTADRSIRTLDAAIRRRFRFIEFMPDPDLLQNTIDGMSVSLKEILIRLNAKITDLVERDKQIGHSYLMKGEDPIDTVEDLMNAWRYEIVPLVQEYTFEDFKQMEEILGKDFVDSEKQIIEQKPYRTEESFIKALENTFPPEQGEDDSE